MYIINVIRIHSGAGEVDIWIAWIILFNYFYLCKFFLWNLSYNFSKSFCVFLCSFLWLIIFLTVANSKLNHEKKGRGYFAIFLRMGCSWSYSTICVQAILIHSVVRTSWQFILELFQLWNLSEAKERYWGWGDGPI